MKGLIFTFKKTLFYTLVFLLLCINKVLIHIIPFKKLIRYYSNASDNIESFVVGENRVNMIRHSINRNRRLLLWKPVCFEQSLTVLLLARFFRLPGSIYFGICKSQNGKMIAHAWSQIGNYWVTGDDQKDRFTVVYKAHYIPKKWWFDYDYKK